GKILLGVTVKLLNRPSVARVTFEQLAATVAEITVNGQNLGRTLWRPYMINADGVFREGLNTIEILVTNDLRNLFGPHHHQVADLIAVAPETFVDKRYWTDDYSFLPFGLGKMFLLLG
ncbi:MAG: hypothetical protein PHH90_11755, partial [Limnochordia bacterium]|nr:hypothetical protein [Limnochordia bacterium]